MKNKEFNVRHLFIIVAGLDKDCINTIEEIYNKNKEEYNKFYINSNFSKDMLKQIFSMKTEDRINKVIGIVGKCYDTNNFINIEKIIKSIHPSIINFVKNSYDVSLEKFRLKYLDGKTMSEEKLFCINGAIMYYINVCNKTISFDNCTHFVMNKWANYINQSVYVNKELFNELSEVNPDITNFDSSVLSPYYSIFDLNYNDVVNENLNCFFDDCIEKRTLEAFGYTLEDATKRIDLDIERYQKERSDQFKKSFIKYVGCLNRFIISLGLDSSDLMNESMITNEVLNNIFSDFEKSLRHNNVPESEKELYIVACLFIYNLVDLYKDSKNMYLNKAQEEKYREIKYQQEKLNKQKDIICEKLLLIEDKNKKQVQEIKDLKEKIKILEKENSRLNGIINKKNIEIEEATIENESLKLEIKFKDEVILNKEVNDDYNNFDVSLDEKIKYINNYKIGIFGGRNNIKFLNDIFDNLLLFESRNQDISSVKNCDMIFINYKYFDHAFFKKINSNILNLDIPKGYIRETNTELIINNIYNSLKNLENSIDVSDNSNS